MEHLRNSWADEWWIEATTPERFREILDAIETRREILERGMVRLSRCPIQECCN